MCDVMKMDTVNRVFVDHALSLVSIYIDEFFDTRYHAALRELVTKHRDYDFMFDFDNTQRMNEEALDMLFELSSPTNITGTVFIKNCPPQIGKILTITQLDKRVCVLTRDEPYVKESGFITGLLSSIGSKNPLPTSKAYPEESELWESWSARKKVDRLSKYRHLPEIARLIKHREGTFELVELGGFLIQILKNEIDNSPRPNVNTIDKTQQLMNRIVNKGSLSEIGIVELSDKALDAGVFDYLEGILPPPLPNQIATWEGEILNYKAWLANRSDDGGRSDKQLMVAYIRELLGQDAYVTNLDSLDDSTMKGVCAKELLYAYLSIELESNFSLAMDFIAGKRLTHNLPPPRPLRED